MINANRFSKPVGTVQLGNVAQLPFEQMMQGLATHQSRYDQIAQAAQQVADRELSYLDADAEAAAGIMERQRQLEQDILDMGDLSRQAREATGKLRGFTKDVYGKHGQGTAIESSYANYQETLKRIQESNLPQKEKDMAMAMWLSNYEGVGEGVDVGYGAKKYNTFRIKNAPEYIDMHKYAREIMANMKPQELAQQNIRMSSDGNWIIKEGNESRILTIDEMMRVIEPIAGSDPKFQEYQNFKGELYRYQINNTPDFIKTANADRKLKMEKAEVARQKLETKRLDLVNGTAKEKQEKINSLIDELQIPINKLTVDGKMGEKTEQALKDIDLFFKTNKLDQEIQFEEWDEDQFVQNYLDNSRRSVFSATADIYDVNDQKYTIDMDANQFALQQRRFAEARRIKEEERTQMYHGTTGGFTTDKDAEPSPYVRINNKGEMEVDDSHPELAKLQEKLQFASRLMYSGEAGDGSFKQWFLRHLPGSTEQKVLEAIDKSYGKTHKERKAAGKAMVKEIEAQIKKEKDRLLVGMKKELSKFQASIDPEGELTQKEVISKYQQMQKMRLTQSGVVVQYSSKKQKEADEEILMNAEKFMANGNAYYVENGVMKVLDRETLNEWGKISGATSHGHITAGLHPSGFASGVDGMVRDSEGNTHRVVLKTSSIEEDQVGKASVQGQSLLNSFEDTKEVVMYNTNGVPILINEKGQSAVKARKEYNRGVPEIVYVMDARLAQYAPNIRPSRIENGYAVYSQKDFYHFNRVVGGFIQPYGD